MKRLEGNSRTAAMLVGVVVTMGGLAWAAVPFYDWFCRVTGYGGTTNVAASGASEILDEIVTVRFDANTASGMPWEFRPVQREMKLKIGETGMAFYEAYNPTDRPVAGTASYNVAPDIAGYYFSKIQCFCFTEQVLQPGERIEMPVVFYVDPDLVDDRDAGRIRNITLSYTFYQTELPEAQANLSPGQSADYN
ncbi:Cytochrome c oxidase assembly protein CtaG [Defluviimonas aquaemixtae]|uniref:Cytochrome c oxidase assembly protein CtaG n=1 Tax=Albidovulum aquaemixtae TaxID=1542388 RepID=A0A2R8BNM3_9RHOB|nr:cytochrome c oxidase assembly protein [Defluviimonas aquaemixtae]SPH24973.1 Cytochrome c oxidase assembly protein CtaG [Defluviimonas aquaemixtae]